jgi:tripartite-type tricarboxylate transporter receptor subunit TctC
MPQFTVVNKPTCTSHCTKPATDGSGTTGLHPLRRPLLLAGAALCAGLLMVGSAIAEQYPSRMVRIITPYPPGGGGDLLARVYGQKVQEKWGQPVMVDNRPGAGTILGTAAAAKAEPDGYTLLITSDSSITSNPHLYSKMSFDPLHDLVPITQLVGSNMMILVHPSVKFRTLTELVAFAKANPNRVQYASFGAGSQPHLSFEALKRAANIDLLHVPYSGLGPATTAVVKGEVMMTLGSAATASGHIKSGKLIPIAITRADPSPDTANLRTFKDAGFADMDPRAWFGIFAPKGTPTGIVKKIQRDIAEILADPEFRKREVLDRGYIAGGMSPEEFAAEIKADYAMKGRLIKTMNIKLEN